MTASRRWGDATTSSATVNLRTATAKRTVGRIQWFGRMIGNHHIGVGPPRDVDVLKGTNMSFRRSAVAGHAFDERLRGYGSQVHSELSICLPLKRHRQRVVYDPAIAVTHYPAPRPHGDDRRYRTTGVVFTFSHNEALEILDYSARCNASSTGCGRSRSEPLTVRAWWCSRGI